MKPATPLRLVSTDFDGTIHADFSHGPVPVALQARLKSLQSAGTLWIINTGRDLPSLMESIGRSRMEVMPDYVVAVEREIYRHVGGHFESVQPWNDRCHADHEALFTNHAEELRALGRSLEERYDATFYADGWSPLCVIARSNSQMDAIQAEFETFTESIPEVVAVRNDVYSRLRHRPGRSPAAHRPDRRGHLRGGRSPERPAHAAAAVRALARDPVQRASRGEGAGRRPRRLHCRAHLW